MADVYDLSGVDIDDDDLNLSGDGWFGPTYVAQDTVTQADLDFFVKHLNKDESQAYGSTGTGLFNPFLNLNGGTTLVGFNRSATSQSENNANNTDMDDPNTDAIQIKDIPIVYLDLDGLPGLEAYYVINLDINESNEANSQVGLSEMQIFL